MPKLLNFRPLLPLYRTPEQALPSGVLSDDHAVFLRPLAAATLALHLLEPTMSAWGTNQLLKAGAAAASGTNPIPALSRFLVASMGLPGLASAAANVTQQMWLQDAQSAYDATFLHHDRNRPALWAMHKGEKEANQREKRTELFAAFLRWGIFNEVNASCDLSRASLQVGVGMVLFSATLGWDVAAALAISAVLIGAYGHYQLGSIVASTEASNLADETLKNHQYAILDNVMLGNLNNYDRYNKTYNVLAAEQESAKRQAADRASRRSLEVLGLAVLPVAAALSWRLLLLSEGAARNNAARDVILQLPHLLGVTYRLVNLSELLTGKFLPARATFKETLRKARQKPALDLDAHIRPNEIRVTHDGITKSFAEMLPQILQAAQAGIGGRYTVAGGNGSGKTTSLLRLQELLLEAGGSLMLPADLSGLAFELRKGSTGEQVIDALNAVIAHGPKTLLLDEWEAHLDPENRRQFNIKFDELTQPSKKSQRRTIIEISHQPRKK